MILMLVGDEMYNIAICDDYKVQLDKLKSIISRYGKNENVKFNIDTFQSGELLIKNGYDDYHIIILDIQMDGINGIETAKIIRENNTDIKIIFVTALEKYWPEGYNVNAFRYLIKPIEDEVFYNEIGSLIDELKKNRQYVNIMTNRYLKKILISDIKYIEIKDRKVAIHTTSGSYISNYSLKYWNERLKLNGFANPHNSYLVNMKYVNSIDKAKVTLIDGESVYISQRKYKEFKDRFIRYVGEM